MSSSKMMRLAAKLIPAGVVLGAMACSAHAAGAGAADPQFDIPLTALAPLLVIPASLAACLVAIFAPRFLKRHLPRSVCRVLGLRARSGKLRLA